MKNKEIIIAGLLILMQLVFASSLKAQCDYFTGAPNEVVVSQPSQSNIGTTSITVTWTKYNDESIPGTGGGYFLYNVEYSSLLNSQWQPSCSNLPDETNTCTITGLSPGTVYFIRATVVATCLDVNGSPIGTDAATSFSIVVTTKPVAPTGLSITSLGVSAFTANWQTTTGAVDYRLDVSPNSSFNSFVAGYNDLTVTGTSQVVNSLSSNTIYYYRVRAVNTGGTSASSTTGQALTLPSAPVAISPTAILSSGFTARWNSVSGTNAVDYRLDVSTNSSFGSFVPGYNNLTVTGTSQVVNSISSNTTHYYRVRAVNSGGTSASSAIEQALTLPSAPVATSAIAISATGFIAQWNSVPGITQYRLDVSTDNSFGSMLDGYTNLLVSGTSQIVTGLNAGTSYHYRVRAENTTGVSANSNVVSTLTVPAAPVVASASVISTNEFTTNWSSSPSATSYLLDVSTNSLFTSFVGLYNNFSVAGTSQTVTGLLPHTQYFVRVRASNSSGQSSYSINSTNSSILTIPSPPTAITPLSITSSDFSAQWNSVSGISQYRLDVSTDNSFSQMVTGYNNLPVSGTSQEVTALNAGVTYYYRVRAQNATGASLSSNTISALLLPPIPPNFRIFDKTKTSVHVKWDVAFGAAQYDLEVASNDLFNPLLVNYNPKVISSGLLEHIVDGLSPSTVYYFRLKARNATGASVTTSPIAARTLDQDGSAVTLQLANPAVPDYVDETVAQEISITVTGAIGNASVRLFHRKNSTGAFVEEPMTLNNGRFRISFNNDWADDFGFQFYFSASDQFNNTVTTQDQLQTLRKRISSVVVPLQRFGKDVRNYHLISVPYDLPDYASLEALFAPIMKGYDNTRWRLVRYENGTNVDYADGLSVQRLKQGYSYWFISKDEIQLNFGAGLTFANAIAAPFEMELKAGWNQIGNPFPYSLLWSDILALPKNAGKTGVLLTYNSVDNILTETDHLKPFEGGFIFAEANTTLTFPVTLPKATGGRLSTMENTIHNTDDWRLSFHVKQGGVINTLAAVGMNSSSTTSLDLHDLVSPPPFVAYPTFSESTKKNGVSLTRSIVEPKRRFKWTYIIDGNPAEPIHLTWDPAQLERHNAQIVLHDVTNHHLIDALRNKEYTIKAAPAIIEIFFSESNLIENANLSLGVPYPNPFVEKLQIPIDFSQEGDEPTEAHVEIKDYHGKTLIAFSQNFFLQTGIREIVWNGCDAVGQPLTSGFYYYNLQVFAANGKMWSRRGKIIKK